MYEYEYEYDRWPNIKCMALTVTLSARIEQK